MRIISFSVNKGGVGKTTAVINTAARMAMLGKRVLAIDLDQQCNLSFTFLKDLPERSLYDALTSEGSDIPIQKVKDNLWILPASPAMFASEHKLQDAASRKGVNQYLLLRHLLERLKQSEFDIILLDSPPSDNSYMINGLYATEEVVIVVKPEPFCVEGVKQFSDMLGTVKKSNKPLRVSGILFNDVESSSAGHRKCINEMYDSIRPKFKFDTVIRHCRYLYNSVREHQDIFSYAPMSNGAADFAAFVEELLIR